MSNHWSRQDTMRIRKLVNRYRLGMMGPAVSGSKRRVTDDDINTLKKTIKDHKFAENQMREAFKQAKNRPRGQLIQRLKSQLTKCRQSFSFWWSSCSFLDCRLEMVNNEVFIANKSNSNWKMMQRDCSQFKEF